MLSKSEQSGMSTPIPPHQLLPPPLHCPVNFIAALKKAAAPGPPHSSPPFPVRGKSTRPEAKSFWPEGTLKKGLRDTFTTFSFHLRKSLKSLHGGFASTNLHCFELGRHLSAVDPGQRPRRLRRRDGRPGQLRGGGETGEVHGGVGGKAEQGGVKLGLFCEGTKEKVLRLMYYRL